MHASYLLSIVVARVSCLRLLATSCFSWLAAKHDAGALPDKLPVCVRMRLPPAQVSQVRPSGSPNPRRGHKSQTLPEAWGVEHREQSDMQEGEEEAADCDGAWAGARTAILVGEEPRANDGAKASQSPRPPTTGQRPGPSRCAPNMRRGPATPPCHCPDTARSCRATSRREADMGEGPQYGGRCCSKLPRHSLRISPFATHVC